MNLFGLTKPSHSGLSLHILIMLFALFSTILSSGTSRHIFLCSFNPDVVSEGEYYFKTSLPLYHQEFKGWPWYRYHLTPVNFS